MDVAIRDREVLSYDFKKEQLYIARKENYAEHKMVHLVSKFTASNKSDNKLLKQFMGFTIPGRIIVNGKEEAFVDLTN